MVRKYLKLPPNTTRALKTFLKNNVFAKQYLLLLSAIHFDILSLNFFSFNPVMIYFVDFIIHWWVIQTSGFESNITSSNFRELRLVLWKFLSRRDVQGLRPHLESHRPKGIIGGHNEFTAMNHHFAKTHNKNVFSSPSFYG